jgi:hypothetical protein
MHRTLEMREASEAPGAARQRRPAIGDEEREGSWIALGNRASRSICHQADIGEPPHKQTWLGGPDYLLTAPTAKR